jgi:ATP-binding cassette, subfamily C (CFTR/MRP), member 4
LFFATARSPIYTHTNTTIEGSSVIRAFKAEAFVQKQFHSHQNLNISASFLFLATTRGFAFWLDIVCVVYISIVIMSFLVLGNGE